MLTTVTNTKQSHEEMKNLQENGQIKDKDQRKWKCSELQAFILAVNISWINQNHENIFKFSSKKQKQNYFHRLGFRSEFFFFFFWIAI